MTTVDLHSMIAPYALNALDSQERARFDIHLQQCAHCRVELAGFHATAARLGDVSSQAPPAELRDRLMTAVASALQERPAVVALTQSSRIRRTLPRLAMAAAFLVGTVGVGGFVVERGQAGDERAVTMAITSVLAAPDADTKSKSFKEGGNVRLITSASRDSAVIFANDMPGLEDGKVYQVWMIKGSSPTSQGTFKTRGTTIMKGLTDVDRVAITIEPSGGSKQPTSAPIATLAV